MKETILYYLKNDRSVQGGIKLYQQIGKKQSVLKNFNITGYEQKALNLLFEELRVLAGLSIVELEVILKTPVNKNAPVIEQKQPSKKTLELIDFPEPVKQALKLRYEFPFLRDKNCPPVLKLLVADKLTAFEKFVENHKKLFDENSDISITARNTVENYLENRQIWDELNYYKENGSFLGKHPEFSKIDLFDKLRAMNNAQLIKRRDTLINGINRDKKNIEKNEKPDLLQQRTEALEKKESELKLVNRLLNINE